MNVTLKSMLLVSICIGAGFAQTSPTLGAWSIYRTGDSQTNHQVVMLQSISQSQYGDTQGNPYVAKLDIICKSGRLSAIAVEPGVTIEKSAMSFRGAVPTTQIAFTADGDSSHFENWAVLDRGQTLSPYSEVSQGKLTRRWIELISGNPTMVLQLHGAAGLSPLQATFNTGDLSKALGSVGCTY